MLPDPTNASAVLNEITANSPHDVAMVLGYVLFSWTLDHDGTLRVNIDRPPEQDPDLSRRIVNSGMPAIRHAAPG